MSSHPLSTSWMFRWDVSWPVRAPLHARSGGRAAASVLPLRSDP